LGVVLGYVAMFVVVFLSLSTAYMAMGADRAFQPGSYEVTGNWLAVMFVVSIVAALFGGFVCATLAPSPKAPLALAVVVLVLGAASAVPEITRSDPPEVREGDVGNVAAMTNAKQPAWVFVSLPVIGAGGAMIGAKLRVRPMRPATA
jgi:hypothetical protein